MIGFLCAPSVLYTLFAIVHIIIRLVRTEYNIAFVEFIVSVIIVMLLQFFCMMDMEFVSWFFVSIPILFIGLFSKYARIAVDWLNNQMNAEIAETKPATEDVKPATDEAKKDEAKKDAFSNLGYTLIPHLSY